MNCRIIKCASQDDWEVAKDLALGTAGLAPVKPVDDEWKTKILKAEHSPIYTLNVTWEWTDLPYWVSVHLVRHNIGITHFVSSQRKNYARGEAPQDTPVTHRCTADYEAILNISRKRLCMKAADDTRTAWRTFLNALEPLEPVLVKLCVPNCIYRNGYCGEPNPCALRKFNDIMEYNRYKEMFL